MRLYPVMRPIGKTTFEASRLIPKDCALLSRSFETKGTMFTVRGRSPKVTIQPSSEIVARSHTSSATLIGGSANRPVVPLAIPSCCPTVPSGKFFSKIAGPPAIA